MNRSKSHAQRHQGKYQYNAIVGCRSPKTGEKTKQHVTVFADGRDAAIHEACNVAASYGYGNCTVNHITRIG
jgi:hypothetical protein